MKKWYFRGSTLIVGFLLAGPFVLPLVWTNPEFSRNKKIILTGVIIFLTLVLTYLFGLALKALYQYYDTALKQLV